MTFDKKPTAPTENSDTQNKSTGPKKSEHQEKKRRDPIMFKGIEIGYTGDLMDDENIPF